VIDGGFRSWNNGEIKPFLVGNLNLSNGCKMKIKSAIFLTALASLIWSVPASADLLHYTLDFKDAGTADIEWNLDSQPVPAFSVPNDQFRLSVANTSPNDPFILAFFTAAD
jgi:hypothetical protein